MADSKSCLILSNDSEVKIAAFIDDNTSKGIDAAGNVFFSRMVRLLDLANFETLTKVLKEIKASTITRLDPSPPL